MPKKKAPNWEDIKTRRTVHHETWEDIREIYNVPLSTLKNRASREKWQYEAVKIGTEIREAHIDREKRIDNAIGELLEEIVAEYRDLRKAGLSGHTVQDGEGFMNEGVKMFLKAGLTGYLNRRKDALEETEPEASEKMRVEGFDRDQI